MRDWSKKFAKELWLKADHTGDHDAAFLRKALRLRRRSRVLDAPCGAGRIAIRLARAGCVVTGVDQLPAFLRRARTRFTRERKKGRFIEADLRTIDFDSEFDAVINWFGSFGYFSDVENADLIRRFARALRKGGRLLVDQSNRERVLRNFGVQSHPGLTIRSRWNGKTQRVHSTWIIRRRGRTRRSRLSIRFYTPAQLRKLMERAGLRVVAVYGSANGERYRRGGKRLIMVGRKT
jgi:SAM-dependent methyltransferase